MFDINKNTPIILYGYSTRGVPVYEQMKTAGYDVKGFFDRNAVKLRKGGQENIWTVEEYGNREKEAVVIVICFENAIEQNKVAEFLYKNGFYKTVYLPMGMEYRQSAARQMREVYNFLLEERYELLKEIPEYEELHAESNAGNIIKKDNGRYTVWMPIEYVYTDNVIRIPYAEEKQKNQEFIHFVHEYMDIPLYMNHIYLSLYRFFLGQGELDENYFRFQDLEDRKEDFEPYKARLLKDRYQLFCIFDQEFNRGDAFFVDSAPRAVWNEKGYFNLTDGHHRSAFLYVMGYTSLPIVITENDYIKYNRFIKSVEMKTIHMNESRSYLVKIMPEILGAVQEYNVSGYWVQDFGQYGGYFAAVVNKTGVLNKKDSFVDKNNKGIIFLLEESVIEEKLAWLKQVHGGLMVLGLKEQAEVQIIEQKTGWNVIKKIGSFFNGEDTITVSLSVKRG